MFEQFNYSLDEGLSLDEEGEITKMMNIYGFFPDALIPGLAQYQQMQGGYNHRRIVGTTAQVGLLLYNMNNLVLWCNKYSDPGQGLVTSMGRRKTAMLGAALPKNPFGLAFRSMAAVSWAIIAYDVTNWALNYGFLGKQKQSFLDGLAAFANPMNYV